MSKIDLDLQYFWTPSCIMIIMDNNITEYKLQFLSRRMAFHSCKPVSLFLINWLSKKYTQTVTIIMINDPAVSCKRVWWDDGLELLDIFLSQTKTTVWKFQKLKSTCLSQAFASSRASLLSLTIDLRCQLSVL